VSNKNNKSNVFNNVTEKEKRQTDRRSGRQTKTANDKRVKQKKWQDKICKKTCMDVLQ